MNSVSFNAPPINPLLDPSKPIPDQRQTCQKYYGVLGDWVRRMREQAKDAYLIFDALRNIFGVFGKKTYLDFLELKGPFKNSVVILADPETDSLIKIPGLDGFDVDCAVFPREAVSKNELEKANCFWAYRSERTYRPIDRINNLFPYVTEVDTRNIKCLDFENPFVQILKDPDENAFDNMETCCFNEVFRAEWNNLKERTLKHQVQAPEPGSGAPKTVFSDFRKELKQLERGETLRNMKLEPLDNERAKREIKDIMAMIDNDEVFRRVLFDNSFYGYELEANYLEPDERTNRANFYLGYRHRLWLLANESASDDIYRVETAYNEEIITNEVSRKNGVAKSPLNHEPVEEVKLSALPPNQSLLVGMVVNGNFFDLVTILNETGFLPREYLLDKLPDYYFSDAEKREEMVVKDLIFKFCNTHGKEGVSQAIGHFYEEVVNAVQNRKNIESLRIVEQKWQRIINLDGDIIDRTLIERIREVIANEKPERVGQGKKEKKAKAKISSTDEFDFWKVIYSDSRIEVNFRDRRKTIELVPEDFGKRVDNKDPETWKRLLIILGQKNAGELVAYQLQDVNEALKRIFDTSITFFRKNEKMPIDIQIERSTLDRREAAMIEHEETREEESAEPDDLPD